MGENAAILGALREAPRWLVTDWGGPGGQAKVSITVAGRVADVTVHDHRASFDGRSVPLSEGRLGQLLREVQSALDAQALGTPAAADAVTRLVDLWRSTPDEASGLWGLRHGAIEWHCTSGLLHVEVGDGGAYDQPLAQPLVDVLVDLGWNAPDHDFRNCWLQPTAETLESTARIAVLTTVTAFGYPEPPGFP
ncbi:MAG: hypothetical protein U0R27_13140 [Candidatus Nanopelagicales bacterium]